MSDLRDFVRGNAVMGDLGKRTQVALAGFLVLWTAACVALVVWAILDQTGTANGCA